MATPITTLDMDKSLLLKSLSLPNKMKMVYASDYGYNILTQLSAKLGPSISTSQAKVEVAALGNLSVYSRVTAASTASGANLIVTVADNSNFRVNDLVADSNMIQGRVVSKGANTLTLSPHSASTWSTTTHFTSGMVAKRFFDVSSSKGSAGKTTLNYTPDLDYAYTSITRESSHQARRDRIASFVNWNNGYWWRSWDDLTLKAFAKQVEFKYAFSERKDLTGADGQYYSTGGVRDSIINRGGKYMQLSSLMTQNDFNDMLSEMARTTAYGGRNLVALMGTDALGRLQMLLGDKYIQWAGNQSTFGGVSVDGIDIYNYSYLGLKISFVRWALLDDPMFQSELSTVTGKPKQSSSIYFLDMTPVPAADGSGSINPIQKYHFNNDELIANYVPGMIGLESSDASSVKKALADGTMASLGTSDMDGVDFHILSDCGIYCIPDKMGLIELAS